MAGGEKRKKNYCIICRWMRGVYKRGFYLVMGNDRENDEKNLEKTRGNTRSRHDAKHWGEHWVQWQNAMETRKHKKGLKLV